MNKIKYKKKTVTATPPFSESSNSMMLWFIVSDVRGVQKFKTGSTYIPACRRDRKAISRATPIFRVEQFNSTIVSIY